MSILAPLYLLGALAIGLPILFHLIRRRPTGAIEFSSLMFLQPTAPRLTRRSRLENWPLLLMRALALFLLAAAFARPFYRKAESVSSDETRQRIVMVIDRSASMQRPKLWEQAKSDAQKLINDLSDRDQLAIIAFDRQPTALFSFEQSADLDAPQRRIAALSVVDGISPTWHATNLGRAISYAADMATQFEADDAAKQSGAEDALQSGAFDSSRIVLISDMQQGGEIESLQQYTWPKKLSLEVRRVAIENRTNASAQILQDGQYAEKSDRVRVRVSNAPDSESSRFTLGFVGGKGNGSGEAATELPVQVPPGESRVVRMPIPDPGVTTMAVSGDDQTFDNQRYLVSREPEQLDLLFIGPAVDQSQSESTAQGSNARDSLLYYLERIPLQNLLGEVTVRQVSPDKLTAVPSVATTPLVVVAQSLSTDVAERLKEYVIEGGRVLFVMADAKDVDMRSSIASVIEMPDDAFQITESKVDDYVMFANIDFGHSIFQPMSDPQFNDFTKIRFWSHRTINQVPGDWSVVARFDDGDPALLENQIDGDGRVWVLTAGWQPSSSQLALSTKFLPLVYSWIGRLSGEINAYGSTTVGQSPPFRVSPTATISDPSGVSFEYAKTSDSDRINQPGIYTYNDEGVAPKRFAVNLAESESLTTPLENESLERFGIRLGNASAAVQSEVVKRQLRDIELEKQQKIWQWLLVAALALLAIETIWGGLLSRGSPGPVVAKKAAA
ncbi:MAG: BatA domain-containing protein [Pirellulaceae bacterium]